MKMKMKMKIDDDLHIDELHLCKQSLDMLCRNKRQSRNTVKIQNTCHVPFSCILVDCRYCLCLPHHADAAGLFGTCISLPRFPVSTAGQRGPAR